MARDEDVTRGPGPGGWLGALNSFGGGGAGADSLFDDHDMGGSGRDGGG